MDQPTAAAVRGWAPPQFDWAKAGYPVPSSGPDPLEPHVAFALGEVLNITGRTLDDILTDADIAVAERVITLKTMVDVMGGTTAALAVLAAPWLRSFTAGSYSEQRFSPAEMAGISGRGDAAPAGLGPEPIATLLWLLMTPEKREEWMYLLTGRSAPAVSFTEFGGCDDVGGWPVVGWGSAIETWPWW